MLKYIRDSIDRVFNLCLVKILIYYFMIYFKDYVIKKNLLLFNIIIIILGIYYSNIHFVKFELNYNYYIRKIILS